MSACSVLSSLKAKFVTFGCKLNFAETSSLADALVEHGVVTASHNETPDIIIVNTCSVTATADKKCRQAIRTLARKFPDASIIVTGCYAQLKPLEVAALPGVALVLGNDRKTTIPHVLETWLEKRHNEIRVQPARDFNQFEHSCSRGNRTRYFLKVQDGCNYYCTYCTIPYARGRSRSPEISELVDAARNVALKGGKEIVLTGVNVGDFGWHKEHTFIDLIKYLDDVEGIERYRISSIEPNLLTDEIINFVASSQRFMPHFHIPLQSGDDEVLKLMRRHYDTALFRDKISAVRDVLPDAFIGVDLIVGMRGETMSRFDKSVEFIESLDISRLHVFPYSEREGTAALDITPSVDSSEKARRAAVMLNMSMKKEEAFSLKMAGQKRPVLFENIDFEQKLTGHTDNYLKVIVPNGTPKFVNQQGTVILGKPIADKESFYSTGELIHE